MTKVARKAKVVPAAKPVDEQFEADFLRYLRTQPDFFARQEDALADMALTHGVGNTASLLERHLMRLRGRLGKLEAQLRNLLTVAKENENHARDLHDLSQQLLRAPDQDAALETLQATMAAEFDVEACRVVILASAEHSTQQCLALNESLPMQLQDAQRTGITACGPLSAQLRKSVFPELDTLKSCAVIPLDRHERKAFLILASSASDQFVEGMGTLFLDMLAGLVAAVMER